MTNIFLSSNCQINGIASAFKLIFYNSIVKTELFPLPFKIELHAANLAQAIEGSDYWVTIAHLDAIQSILSNITGKKPVVIRIPPIGFSAFHPDLCYVEDVSTGKLTNHHYNSAIMAWAYKNRLDENHAEKLFCNSNFGKLGYFNQWSSNVDFLRNSFNNCDLGAEFGPFFLNIQRTGCFMHSVNHPKIHVLAGVAKIAAIKMGCDRSILSRHLELEDDLSNVIWPIYPDVADELSLGGGSYAWKVGAGQVIEGVRSYIEFCYQSYAKQEISPDCMRILNRDSELLDSVLGAQIGLEK